MFSPKSVCLIICQQDYAKTTTTTQVLSTDHGGEVEPGPWRNPLYFGADPGIHFHFC